MSESLSPRESFSKMMNRPPSDVGSARILLVDDKKELLTSLYHLVTLYGYEADQALGGEAALEAISNNEYDVVLLDLIMPGVSGHDILDFAAREKLNCKVIVVSGDSSFSGVKHALHCGAFDFVKKPYEAAELIATMETALRQVRLENQHDEMESQLKQSEELHRFIVNSSPDLVYMLDRNGCFTFINDRIESMLGIDRKALVGRHYSDLVDEDDIEKANNLFNERRTGARAGKNVEIRLKSERSDHRQGMSRQVSIWAEVTAMGIYDDNVDRNRDSFIGSYGTARDISERKKAEEVINFQAYHDLLTHLPNRALLNACR
jgi:PAS domain S-box-containing protein